MPTTQSNVPFDLASASDLVDYSVQNIYLKDKLDPVKYHKEFYSIEENAPYIAKDSGLSQVDSYGYLPENGIIKASSPVQTFDKSYTQIHFAGKLRITDAMWRFGIQVRRLQGIVSSLKKVAMQSKEKILTNPINNMTSTTYTETTGSANFTHTNTGGDSVAPASAAHTREDGGTNWANIITDGTTNNMDFDYDALRAAHTVGQAILGPIGETLDQTFDVIMVKKNSAVAFRAKEILKALQDNKLPRSADNDGAGIPPYKILENPYFTSETAWAMFASGENQVNLRGFQLKQGVPLSLGEQYVNNDNMEICYNMDEYYTYGFNDLRNWLFSTGLNA